MPGGHEITLWIVVLRNVHRRPQSEVVGLTTEDEGPSIVRLQGNSTREWKGKPVRS